MAEYWLTPAIVLFYGSSQLLGGPMLLRYTVENHLSVAEPVEVSFAATSLKDDKPTYGDIPGLAHGALTVVGLFGANASGKTNILKSLYRVRSEVVDSFSERKPGADMDQTPFRLAGALATQPTTFTVDFLADGTRYEFGLRYSKSRVLLEWLYAFPSNRRRVLYVREAGEGSVDSYQFGSTVKGKGLLRQVTRTTRPNATFISTCAQHNAPNFAPAYEWFNSSLVFGPTAESRSEVRRFDPDAAPILREAYRPVVRQLLSAADVGVEDFASKPDKNFAARAEQIIEQEQELPASMRAQFQKLATEPPHRITLGHRSRSGELVYLEDHLESSGTRSYLFHINFALDVLARGAVLVVDEIAATLHSRMVEQLVALFTDSTSNPHGAQLLFSSHDQGLLRAIRRDGVVLIDKAIDGASYATPISDFRVRKREDLLRAYEQGRFGGVPVLGSLTEVMADFHAAQGEVARGEAED